MLAEEYVLIDISLISCIMVRLIFAMSIEVYSSSAFLFIFSYRAEGTRNTSTAERFCVNFKTFSLNFIFLFFKAALCQPVRKNGLIN